jgi:hypothetical protein
MAREDGSFVKDSMNPDIMLEVGQDKIFDLSFRTTVEGAKGKRYIHADLILNHDNAVKILKLFDPKRVKWKEWLAPTSEEREKNKNAKGHTVPYDGSV